MIFFEEMFLKNYLNSSYEYSNDYYNKIFRDYVNIVSNNRIIYSQVIDNNNKYLNKLIFNNNNTYKYIDALVFDNKITYYIKENKLFSYNIDTDTQEKFNYFLKIYVPNIIIHNTYNRYLSYTKNASIKRIQEYCKLQGEMIYFLNQETKKNIFISDDISWISSLIDNLTELSNDILYYSKINEISELIKNSNNQNNQNIKDKINTIIEELEEINKKEINKYLAQPKYLAPPKYIFYSDNLKAIKEFMKLIKNIRIVSPQEILHNFFEIFNDSNDKLYTDILDKKSNFSKLDIVFKSKNVINIEEINNEPYNYLSVFKSIIIYYYHFNGGLDGVNKLYYFMINDYVQNTRQNNKIKFNTIYILLKDFKKMLKLPNYIINLCQNKLLEIVNSQNLYIENTLVGGMNANPTNNNPTTNNPTSNNPNHNPFNIIFKSIEKLNSGKNSTYFFKIKETIKNISINGYINISLDLDQTKKNLMKILNKIKDITNLYSPIFLLLINFFIELIEQKKINLTDSEIQKLSEECDIDETTFIVFYNYLLFDNIEIYPGMNEIDFFIKKILKSDYNNFLYKYLSYGDCNLIINKLYKYKHYFYTKVTDTSKFLESLKIDIDLTKKINTVTENNIFNNSLELTAKFGNYAINEIGKFTQKSIEVLISPYYKFLDYELNHIRDFLNNKKNYEYNIYEIYTESTNNIGYNLKDYQNIINNDTIDKKIDPQVNSLNRIAETIYLPIISNIDYNSTTLLYIDRVITLLKNDKPINKKYIEFLTKENNFNNHLLLKKINLDISEDTVELNNSKTVIRLGYKFNLYSSIFNSIKRLDNFITIINKYETKNKDLCIFLLTLATLDFSNFEDRIFLYNKITYKQTTKYIEDGYLSYILNMKSDKIIEVEDIFNKKNDDKEEKQPVTFIDSSLINNNSTVLKFRYTNEDNKMFVISDDRQKYYIQNNKYNGDDVNSGNIIINDFTANLLQKFNYPARNIDDVICTSNSQISKIYLFNYNIALKYNIDNIKNTMLLIDLETDNEYKVVYDLSNHKMFKLWLLHLENVLILSDNDNNYKMCIIMNDNALNDINQQKYWFDNGSNSIINTKFKKKVHFLTFNTNTISFKINNINDFHALFLCLYTAENSICLQLLQNRIISDVIYIDKHLQKENYLYYEQIKYFSINTKNKLSIPFRNLYYPNEQQTTDLYKITENPVNSTYTNNNLNNDFKSLYDYASDIIIFINKLHYSIKNIKKNYDITSINNNMKKYIENFNSICSSNLDKKEIIYYGNIFDNLIDRFNTDISNDMINCINKFTYDQFFDFNYDKKFFNLRSLYLNNSDVFYTLLIIKKFVDFKNLHLDINCGEILRLISSLDTNIIYPFTSERTLSDILFELHNELFIRKEQKELITNFINNLNISKYAYEILMGKGKTSTLTPLYILYKSNTNFDFIITLPNHLVNSSYDIITKITDLFNNTLINVIDNSIETKTINENINNNNFKLSKKSTTKINKISIISDSNLKYYCLYNISKNLLLNNQFDKQTIFIFDEIDTLIDPTKNYLNISFKNKKVYDKIIYLCNVLCDIAINVINKEVDILKDINFSKDSKFSEINKYLEMSIKKNIKTLLDYKYNKNYGFTKLIIDIDQIIINKDKSSFTNFLKAIPYNAINEPMEGSEFSDFELSIILTYLSYFENNFRYEDCIIFCDYIENFAKNDTDEFITSQSVEYFLNSFEHIKESSSDIEILITVLTKIVDIKKEIYDEDTKSEKIDSLKSNIVKEFKKLFDDLPIKKNIILFYVRTIVSEYCFTYNEDKFNISTVDLLDTIITPNKICFSGTVNFNLPSDIIKQISDIGYHNDQLSNITQDNIAQGEIESAIKSFTHSKKSKIFESFKLSDSEVEEKLIDYLLNNIMIYDAFIDVGGYILKTKPFDLVQKIADKVDKYILYINDNNERTIYYNKQNSKYKNQTFNNCFIYYDNKNCVGIDFKQPFKMHALVTISSKNNLTQVAQGVYRLRNINIGHTVEYFTDNSGETIKNYDNLYDQLKKIDEDNKKNLEKNAALQCIKYIIRKNNDYASNCYEEKNYIATIILQKEYEFNIEQIKEKNKNKIGIDTTILESENITNVTINKNVSTSVNRNIQISVDINYNINKEISWLQLQTIRYEGKIATYTFKDYCNFKIETEFKYANYGIIKDISFFDFNLIISPDILYHIINFTELKKQYFRIYFESIYYILNIDLKKIMMISYYEYNIIKNEYYKNEKSFLETYKNIFITSDGYIDLCPIEFDKNIFIKSILYKKLGVILFNKSYNKNIIFYTLTEYFKNKNSENILDILREINNKEYRFKYSYLDLSKLFIKEDSYKNIVLWNKIFNNTSSIETIIESYEKFLEEIKDNIKECNYNHFVIDSTDTAFTNVL